MINRNAVNEHIMAIGEDRPDLEWILSPLDTWERNPFFQGGKTEFPEFDDLKELK